VVIFLVGIIVMSFITKGTVEGFTNTVATTTYSWAGSSVKDMNIISKKSLKTLSATIDENGYYKVDNGSGGRQSCKDMCTDMANCTAFVRTPKSADGGPSCIFYNGSGTSEEQMKAAGYSIVYAIPTTTTTNA
jgi:hypothetical protein